MKSSWQGYALAAVVMLGGATASLVAEDSGGQVVHPPGIYQCYHNMWTCSFEDSDAYWSHCDPAIKPNQEIWWYEAKEICTTYNEQ